MIVTERSQLEAQETELFTDNSVSSGIFKKVNIIL